jgi:hypothetical protein
MNSNYLDREVQSVERSHPWVLLAYAFAFVVTIALSALWPFGWAS